MGESQSPLARLTFLAKVQGLRAQRSLQNLRHPITSWPRNNSPFSGQTQTIASPLYADDRPEEHIHELGKIANPRAAARLLNGTEIPAGQVFSFRRQLGPASPRRGFVRGRMLQLGCVVPAIGGDLCQLSNALYGLALQTGCESLSATLTPTACPAARTTTPPSPGTTSTCVSAPASAPVLSSP